MAIALKTPSTLSAALRLAADLAEKNEALEKQLAELQNPNTPDVLLGKHILKLMGWSSSTLSEKANHPAFPHINKDRKKGEAIRCFRWDFYEFLKNHGG